MSGDCLFCKIVAGEIPSQQVFADDHAFAVLDIRPLVEGHTLVVPRAHAVRLADLAPDDAGALFRAVQRVAAAVERATGATGATVAVNDGVDAGQEVPHVHVHVVPRRAGDGHGPIHRLFGGGKPADDGRLGSLAEAMRGRLAASRPA